MANQDEPTTKSPRAPSRNEAGSTAAADTSADDADARRRSRERLLSMWRHAVDHVVDGNAAATVQPSPRPARRR